jgi:hypothetical protein
MDIQTLPLAHEDELVLDIDPEVNSAQMSPPTETAFNKLVERVKTLEGKPEAWVQKHATAAWVLAFSIPTVVGVLALFVGVLPLLENYLDLHIRSEVASSLEGPKQEISSINTQIANINGELSVILPLVIGQSQRNVHDAAQASGEEFPSRLSDLKAALAFATEQHVKLDEPTLKNVSQKLVEAVSLDNRYQPVAWDTFVQLIRYYSYLHATNDPDYRSDAPPTPPFALSGLGIEGMTIVGGTISLDGVSWKNVVFRNSTIKYSGGFLQLDNVQFEGCRFEMPISKPAIELGQKMLASNTVTLKHSG